MSDQETANRRADEAIAELVAAYDLLDPGFVVTSWILVLASEHAEMPHVAGYARAYSGGHMPKHIEIGLLTIALDAIRSGEDDEGELG